MHNPEKYSADLQLSLKKACPELSHERMRHMIDGNYPGMDNHPDFEAKVLWEVKRRKQQEERISFSLRKPLRTLLVAAVLIVLVASAAFAAILLNGRDIADQAVLPLAVQNDAGGLVENYTQGELSAIVRLAQENGIALSDELMLAFQSGNTYPEASVIMELAVSAFGSFDQWSIQQQYWFGEAMVEIGYQEKNNYRIPKAGMPDADQIVQAVTVHAAEQPDIVLDHPEHWKQEIHLRCVDEAADTLQWYVCFQSTDTDATRIEALLDENGTIDSFDVYLPDQTLALDVVDALTDTYGSYALWSTETWVQLKEALRNARATTENTRLLKATDFILPPEGTISQAEAEQVATNAVHMDNAKANGAVCFMDNNQPVWKIEIAVRTPETLASGRYAHLYNIEMNAYTGEILEMREYTPNGNASFLSRWLPFSLWE